MSATPDCIEGLEWANERARKKDLYLDASSSRGIDCLREAQGAWIKARKTFGPVGHHLQLSYSLRNRGCREAQGRTGGQ
jgi:hypothetical protein